MDFTGTLLIAIVFLIGIILAFVIGQKIGSYKKNREWEKSLPDHRKQAIMQSRAVLSGNFSEQLAPYLPNFEHSPTECRFIGKPIDFIVFKGADEKNIEEIIFVEVKSGKSKLSPQEKNLKKAIENGHVRFEEYRVPEELTKEKEYDFKFDDE